MSKRKREDVAPDTPSRRGRPTHLASETVPTTPSKSLLRTPSKQSNANTPNKRVTFDSSFPVPSNPFTTPQKHDRISNVNGNPGDRDLITNDPPIVFNANRSARRKSARAVIQRTIEGDLSNDDEDDEEDNLARRILGEEESDEELGSDTQGDETPKATPKKRGRPAGKKKEKSPPAPISTEGFNSYFEQNRARGKTSSSTLASLPPLSPTTYFRLVSAHEGRHAVETERLASLHKNNFQQWSFELEEGFNLLLYGYGSKRSLIMEFIAQYAQGAPENPIVIVNGFIPTISIKEVLNMIVTALLGQNHNRKLGSNPNDMLDMLLVILDEESSGKPEKYVTLVIHSLEATSLKSPQSQSILSRLSSHLAIRFIASIDHILAPMLWDSSTFVLFNFVFHDATTFVPYTLETSTADDADSILDVLTGGGFGRSGRSGARGVKYVLASLPGNAKGLYRVLIANQLQSMEEDDAGHDKMGGEAYGLEFKALYQKASEEFLATSDMAFRTLLKEFHDHQMVTSRKDLQGTEILWAPFRKEELETILEDLMLG